MIRAIIGSIGRGDRVNFLLTNRIPRRLATRLAGWFGRIEHPLVCRASIAVWRVFADLDLSDAAEPRFASLHACFTRSLRPGARPADPDPGVLASPSDAIVGACGPIGDGGEVLQVKGSPYALAELLDDAAHAAGFAGGSYVTLRLTSAMYHRFHAPHDCTLTSITHLSGDTWNVNPPALRRVPRLYCRNERAVIRTTLHAGGHAVTLVPVAAILVAGIRLRFLDMPAGRARRSRWSAACHAVLAKGEEIGWFEHGSTIVVIAPAGFALCDGIRNGLTLRAGQALLRMPVGGGSLLQAGRQESSFSEEKEAKRLCS